MNIGDFSKNELKGILLAVESTRKQHEIAIKTDRDYGMVKYDDNPYGCQLCKIAQIITEDRGGISPCYMCPWTFLGGEVCIGSIFYYDSKASVILLNNWADQLRAMIAIEP